MLSHDTLIKPEQAMMNLPLVMLPVDSGQVREVHLPNSTVTICPGAEGRRETVRTVGMLLGCSDLAICKLLCRLEACEATRMGKARPEAPYTTFHSSKGVPSIE